MPDPGDDAGMSEEAAETDAPTADPEDIVSESLRESPRRCPEPSTERGV